MTRENGNGKVMSRQPSVWLSLLPMLVLMAFLAFTIRSFGSDSLSGASQIVLLSAAAFCIFIGMVFLDVPWSEFEKAITSNVANVGSALIILLLIGALGGAWMTSGVVPTLIYYGVQIINPHVFLASTCVICAIVSVMTGSSWTTIATIGVALMGIGRAQGFSDGWIAGAIISGAYFGDKISPLSDTTVLTSSSANVPIFTHIKYMLVTTVPSITIALVLFFAAGLLMHTDSGQDIEGFRIALGERFNISPWLLAVPLITGILIAKRTPSLTILFLSALLALVFGCIFQREALIEIDSSIFKAAMKCLYDSTALHTGNPMLSELVQTGGMSGMMNTIWLIICAMCFGGAMSAGGFVDGITRMFIHLIKGRTSLVGATVASGLIQNIAVADQYLNILLTSNMFKGIYDKQHYERRLLSRTTEDCVTVTSVLVPWNTCGMAQSTVLGVSTMTYLPYCFFNLLSPITSIVVASIGYKIYRTKTEK